VHRREIARGAREGIAPATISARYRTKVSFPKDAFFAKTVPG
jgi:hypothetical protein